MRDTARTKYPNFHHLILRLLTARIFTVSPNEALCQSTMLRSLSFYDIHANVCAVIVDDVLFNFHSTEQHLKFLVRADKKPWFQMEICVNEIQIILEVHLITEVEYYQKLSRSATRKICPWENLNLYVIQAVFTYTWRTPAEYT